VIENPMIIQSKDLPLLTDLYELTMAQSYFQENHNGLATFSLFIRKYPAHRGYFVSCGLEDMLHFLEDFHFTNEAIDKLHRTRIFSAPFLEYLKTLRFTGEVRAIPEGCLFFRDEPIMEVTAPIIESQLVEPFIINQMNLQVLIASKAARCVYAAHGRKVVDFSLRRTQGIDAGMKVARASYIGGAAATSNVLAGINYNIPLSGTMAHSYISSYDQELEAFRSFVQNFPERSILLIDTYDTIAGAHKAVQVAQEMAARGQHLQGVRIDSGDLLRLSQKVRHILDEAGFPDVQIVGSGGLDEFDLEELSRQGAPFNAYGVGTKMGVSGDAPWTDMAYKLVRYNGNPVLKLSSGKISLPGAKQVWRFREEEKLHHDVIALQDEVVGEGEPLLKTVMANGCIVAPLPSLPEIRDRFKKEFNQLEIKYKSISNPDIYPVQLSRGLQELSHQLENHLRAIELEPDQHTKKSGRE
jgi:nicotinate phosphoribosyltransferase